MVPRAPELTRARSAAQVAALLAMAAFALMLTLSLAACDAGSNDSEVTPGPDTEAGAPAVGAESEDEGAAELADAATAEAGDETAAGAGDETAAGTGDTGSATGATGGAPTSEAAAIATARVAERLPQQVTAFGEAGSEPGQMMLPFDVAVGPDGDVYLSDSTGVQRFTTEGELVGRIGEGEILTALGGVAIGPEGNVYVTGFESQVLAYGPDGASLAPIGQTGSEPGHLSRPVDVAVDSTGDLYIADAENRRVDKFTSSGTYLLSFGEAGSGRGELRRPSAVAVNGDGVVYVGEGDDFLIKRYTPDGEFLDAFGQSHADENIWRVGGLAIAEDGTVYVTQALSNRLQAFDPDAGMTLAWEFGSLGRAEGEFSTPMGLDIVGDQLYIADQQNNRVVIYRLKQ